MPVASWGAKHTNKMPAQAVNNQLIPRGSHRRSRVYARDKLKITFMSLPPGTRLGPYEIAEPIGSGGMGDVYRARDTRLDRDVAIKVLPERVARDAEARMRFEREAKAVAALTHQQRPRCVEARGGERCGHRGRTCRRAREKHHPSRSEAGEHLPHHRR